MQGSAYITLTILIIVFFLEMYLYRVRFLLHPSFWFLIIWILSISSFIIYLSIGLDFIIFDSELILELLHYVVFSALCFLMLSLISYKKLRTRFTNWDPVIDDNLFMLLAIIIFAVNIANFLINSSFNLVENRETMIIRDIKLAINENQSLPATELILNFFKWLNMPLIILAGFLFCKNFVQNNLNLRLVNKYYFLPVLTGVINTLAIGGRAGIISTIMFFFIGFSLAINSLKQPVFRIIKKTALYGLAFFVLFSIYSTFVTVIRERSYSQLPTMIEVRFNSYPLIKPFSGLIQYLTDHYPGYQLRRIDNTTPEFEMGQICLSGFTTFKIPVFSQLAGSPISIQSVFNLYEPEVVRAHIEREESGFLWVGATATLFLPLYDDFGYKGTFIAIFVLILFTQLIYNNIFSLNKVHFLSILPLVLIYYVWYNSIFSHHILGNWISSYFYSFLIIDIICWVKRNY